MFCSDDEEIVTGASPSTLTQEIDSALDRMMSSGGRGQTSMSGEEFPAENLQGWAHYTTPGTVPVSKSYKDTPELRLHKQDTFSHPKYNYIPLLHAFQSLK